MADSSKIQQKPIKAIRKSNNQEKVAKVARDRKIVERKVAEWSKPTPDEEAEQLAAWSLHHWTPAKKQGGSATGYPFDTSEELATGYCEQCANGTIETGEDVNIHSIIYGFCHELDDDVPCKNDNGGKCALCCLMDHDELFHDELAKRMPKDDVKCRILGLKQYVKDMLTKRNVSEQTLQEILNRFDTIYNRDPVKSWVDCEYVYKIIKLADKFSIKFPWEPAVYVDLGVYSD